MDGETETSDRLTLEEAVAEMHRSGQADPKYVEGYVEGYHGKRERNPYSVSSHVKGIRAGRDARIRGAHDAPPLHPARAHGAETEPTKRENELEGSMVWDLIKIPFLLIALLPALAAGLFWLAGFGIVMWFLWILFQAI